MSADTSKGRERPVEPRNPFLPNPREARFGSRGARGDGRVPLGSTKKRPGDPGVGSSRPTDFASHNVIAPNPRLTSATVTGAEQVNRERLGIPKFESRRPAGSLPTLNEVLGSGASAAGRPSWTEVVSLEIASKRKSGSYDPSREWERAEMAGDQAGRKHGSRNRDDDDSEHWEIDSPLRYRRLNDSRPSTSAFIREALRNRRASQAAFVAIALIFLATLDVPWKRLLEAQSVVKDKFVAAANTLSRPIEERAAFFMADDFDSDIEQWLSRGSEGLAGGSVARLTPGSMFLRQDTLKLASYRMDFDTKIQSGAVGWAVRASDFENYYGFKLVQSQAREQTRFYLERFTLSGGNKLASGEPFRVELPGDLARSGAFNRISVRVRGEHITTMINGFGVDYWQDSHYNRGGVGLFADGGETALVRRMTVSGNDDSWGLFLYGTIETLRSVRERISPNAAMMLLPSPLVTANRDPYAAQFAFISR